MGLEKGGNVQTASPSSLTN